MRRVWWAVWLAEIPDEGSMHYKARTSEEALSKAKSSRMQWTDGDEELELVVRRVSAAAHREWLQSDR